MSVEKAKESSFSSVKKERKERKEREFIETGLNVLYYFLESNLHCIAYSLQCPKRNQDDFKSPSLPELNGYVLSSKWNYPRISLGHSQSFSRYYKLAAAK